MKKIPFCFSYNTLSKKTKWGGIISVVTILHFKEILGEILYLKLKKRPSGWQDIQFQKILCLYPIYTDNYLYVTEEERISYDTDIINAMGLRLISSSPLVWSLLKNYSFKGIVEYYDMACVLLDTGIKISDDEIFQIRNEIENTDIQKIRSNLLFGKELHLSDEIAREWNWKKLLLDHVNQIYETKDITFKNDWLEESIYRIIDNKLPVILIKTNYLDEVHSNSIHLYNLKYIVSLSYEDIAYGDTKDIYIHQNGDIDLPCCSMKQLKTFLDSLDFYSDQKIVSKNLDYSEMREYLITNQQFKARNIDGTLYSLGNIQPPYSERDNTIPDKLPENKVYIGDVYRQKNTWYVDIYDTYTFEIVQLENVLLEDTDIKIRELWKNGYFLSPWGRYLYFEKNKISIHMVSTPKEFTSDIIFFGIMQD